MMKRTVYGLSVLVLVAYQTAARADGADPVMGKAQFAPCGSCHTVEANGPNKVGPNLHGILGRKAGTAPGYTYSEAMQKSAVVWDERALDAYIKDPATFIPGNKMPFIGIPKDQVRANIIAYLKK